MHIGEIITADAANGIGTRVSVFVSGCLNHCKGYFQPETWDFNYGCPFTEELIQKIISELEKPYYDGLTILGGEPFELQNQPDVACLIRRIKNNLDVYRIYI